MGAVAKLNKSKESFIDIALELMYVDSMSIGAHCSMKSMKKKSMKSMKITRPIMLQAEERLVRVAFCGRPCWTEQSLSDVKNLCF